MKKRGGFTIVELLIVIIVIAVLATITVVSYNGVTRSARESVASDAVAQANQKVLLYAADHNDIFPVDISHAGVKDDAYTTFQYGYDFSDAKKKYCITATAGGVSYFIDNEENTKPSKGACAGHGTNGRTAITNFIPNPGFEGDVVGWHTISGAPAPISTWGGNGYSAGYDTMHKRSGGRSLRLTGGPVAADRYFENITLAPLEKGMYTVSAWVYLHGTGDIVLDRNQWVRCRDGGACSNNSGGTDFVLDQTKQDEWRRYSSQINVTSPTSALWLRFYVPTNSTMYIDDLMLTRGSTLYDFADGDTPGWVWNGTRPQATSMGVPL